MERRYLEGTELREQVRPQLERARPRARTLPLRKTLVKAKNTQQRGRVCRIPDRGGAGFYIPKQINVYKIAFY